MGCLVSEQCAGEISEFTVLQPDTDYLFYVFTTDPENCGQYQFVTTGVYLGCMDPVAPNYDPEATMDDGSCNYLNAVPANNTCGTAIELACGVPLGSTGRRQPWCAKLINVIGPDPYLVCRNGGATAEPVNDSAQPVCDAIGGIPV